MLVEGVGKNISSPVETTIATEKIEQMLEQWKTDNLASPLEDVCKVADHERIYVYVRASEWQRSIMVSYVVNRPWISFVFQAWNLLGTWKAKKQKIQIRCPPRQDNNKNKI